MRSQRGAGDSEGLEGQENLGVSSQEPGVRRQGSCLFFFGESHAGREIQFEARRPARTLRDLLVWQKAHEFVLAVYRFTAGFPRQETYGLALQMRRAAVSIPANIVEGFRKRGRADKVRFMNLAEGSVEESRY